MALSHSKSFTMTACCLGASVLFQLDQKGYRLDCNLYLQCPQNQHSKLVLAWNLSVSSNSSNFGFYFKKKTLKLKLGFGSFKRKIFWERWPMLVQRCFNKENGLALYSTNQKEKITDRFKGKNILNAKKIMAFSLELFRFGLTHVFPTLIALFWTFS